MASWPTALLTGLLAARAAAQAAQAAAQAAQTAAPAEEVAFLDATTLYCFQAITMDASCCRDLVASPGVGRASVRRPDAAWTCGGAQDCGGVPGRRGDDLLWWVSDADCTTPRILYVHGGEWEHYGPNQGSYDVLASKIASEARAVVMVPDFSVGPMGNYTDTQRALWVAWSWLGNHGPPGPDSTVPEDCSAAPSPPLFVAGDASGAASALSLALALQAELAEPGALATATRPPAGIFAFSPWTNLACDSPSYYTNVHAEAGEDVYAGDLTLRLAQPAVSGGCPLSSPRETALAARRKAEAHLGGPSLLRNPVASPLYATQAALRRLPPLYFAVSGEEVREADAVVFASRAAQAGAAVVQDIFHATWHNFPLYSEGCGSGSALWPGVAALRHAGQFVQQVAAIAAAHPELVYRVQAEFAPAPGATPSTNVYYPHPSNAAPWTPVQNLSLGIFVPFDAPGAATPAAVPPSIVPSSSAAGTGAAEPALPAPPAPPSPALATTPAPQFSLVVPRALPEEEGHCEQSTLAGAYLAGAAGGAIGTMLLGVALTLTTGKHQGLSTYWSGRTAAADYESLQPCSFDEGAPNTPTTLPPAPSQWQDAIPMHVASGVAHGSGAVAAPNGRRRDDGDGQSFLDRWLPQGLLGEAGKGAAPEEGRRAGSGPPSPQLTAPRPQARAAEMQHLSARRLAAGGATASTDGSPHSGGLVQDLLSAVGISSPHSPHREPPPLHGQNA